MMHTGSMRRITLAGFCVLSLAGCASSRGGAIPYNVSNFGTPDVLKVSQVDDTYKLGPLDTVTVTVFQVADISHDYAVDQSGRITMPLVGQVDAIGLNTTELAAVIQRQLGAKYLRNPNVTVSLKQSNSRVTVDGSVRQPGVYPAVGALTLMQVVALARGTDDMANPHRVAIFRMISGKRMAAAFDLISIRRGTEQDPAIYPGDTVIVDGSALRKAQRDIFSALPLTSLFMGL